MILLGLIVAYHALEVQVIIFPIITTTLVQYTPNNSRSNHVSQKKDNNVLKTLCQPDPLAKQLNKTNLMKILKFTPRQRLQRDVGTLPNINLASPKLTHAPEEKKTSANYLGQFSEPGEVVQVWLRNLHRGGSSQGREFNKERWNIATGSLIKFRQWRRW